MLKCILRSVMVGALTALLIVLLWAPVDVLDDLISWGDYDWIVLLAFVAGFFGNLVARDPDVERWLEKIMD